MNDNNERIMMIARMFDMLTPENQNRALELLALLQDLSLTIAENQD